MSSSAVNSSDLCSVEVKQERSLINTDPLWWTAAGAGHLQHCDGLPYGWSQTGVPNILSIQLYLKDGNQTNRQTQVKLEIMYIRGILFSVNTINIQKSNVSTCDWRWNQIASLNYSRTQYRRPSLNRTKHTNIPPVRVVYGHLGSTQCFYHVLITQPSYSTSQVTLHFSYLW